MGNSNKPLSGTQLRIALQEKVSTLSQAQIAQKAGVAIRTVSGILQETFAKDPSPTDPNITPKQLRGYIGSLVRLADYLNIDLAETLSDYGINIDLASQDTQALLDSALKHSEHLPVLDPNCDILPLIHSVAKADYSGKVTLTDLARLQQVEQTMGTPLTPEAAKALLASKQSAQPH